MRSSPPRAMASRCSGGPPRAVRPARSPPRARFPPTWRSPGPGPRSPPTPHPTGPRGRQCPAGHSHWRTSPAPSSEVSPSAPTTPGRSARPYSTPSRSAPEPPVREAWLAGWHPRRGGDRSRRPRRRLHRGRRSPGCAERTRVPRPGRDGAPDSAPGGGQPAGDGLRPGQHVRRGQRPGPDRQHRPGNGPRRHAGGWLSLHHPGRWLAGLADPRRADRRGPAPLPVRYDAPHRVHPRDGLRRGDLHHPGGALLQWPDRQRWACAHRRAHGCRLGRGLPETGLVRRRLLTSRRRGDRADLADRAGRDAPPDDPEHQCRRQPFSRLVGAHDRHQLAGRRGHLRQLVQPDPAAIGPPPALDPAEAMTNFAIWAMWSAPLIAGNDPRTMGAGEIRNILLNRDIIGIDQDPLGRPATLVLSQGGWQVWRKPLPGGRAALAIVNLAGQAATATFAWSPVGPSAGPPSISDAGSRRPVPPGASLRVRLGAHATAVYLLGG